jgi:hypothetical protein
MGVVARLGACFVRGALAALLVSVGAQLVSLTDANAQRQLVDPQRVSLKLADLPRGFSIVERETASEPLRVGPTDADIVGVNFRTVMERPRTLEHLQSGPVRVGQIIARSDDPTRATFSLDAQREYNVSEHGYEAMEAPVPADEILCLVRRDGPFVEYRIVVVKNGDTLVSTTAIGLPSAVNLDGALALTRVSLARYDEQVAEILAAQPPPAAPAGSADPNLRAIATATPTPAPPPAAAPALPTPRTTPTTPPAVAAAPPPPAPPPAAPAPKAKLPSNFDERLGQPWSELMSSTATTRSGEKMTAFVRRVVEETDLKVGFGSLGPNVGGEHRSVVSMDGDRAKVVESAIILNRDVMNESPRVLAAMLAHEITHANQPVMRSGGKFADCVEAEVEGYGVQARVWYAFWGQAVRPGQTKWERTMNYVEEVWKDSGEAGLRFMIRGELGTDAHSCIG